MKEYILLFRHENANGKVSPEQMQQWMKQQMDWVAGIAAQNKFVSGTGLLFAVIGNYLPNLKPNYFAGLRLPWTLENADNWRKTHALAGKLWFAGGLFLAAICLFLPTVIAIITFFVVMTVITIIPCVYSYRLYKAQKQNH